MGATFAQRSPRARYGTHTPFAFGQYVADGLCARISILDAKRAERGTERALCRGHLRLRHEEFFVLAESRWHASTQGVSFCALLLWDVRRLYANYRSQIRNACAKIASIKKILNHVRLGENAQSQRSHSWVRPMRSFHRKRVIGRPHHFFGQHVVNGFYVRKFILGRRPRKTWHGARPSPQTPTSAERGEF